MPIKNDSNRLNLDYLQGIYTTEVMENKGYVVASNKKKQDELENLCTSKFGKTF